MCIFESVSERDNAIFYWWHLTTESLCCMTILNCCILQYTSSPRKYFFKIRFRIFRKYWRNVSSIMIIVNWSWINSVWTQLRNYASSTNIIRFGIARKCRINVSSVLMTFDGLWTYDCIGIGLHNAYRWSIMLMGNIIPKYY